ncbi:CPBP family intramembrane metalloprotease [Shewanella sp. 10N.7]|uniref:CPBP family intramembrane glutamic endopeptidase n=1 Tax=Shewanella sp. 10N.7 TaxID=2885093 RepID=UPI001E55A24A|nr:CPBP family intramembrane glutamic endopeptidase [Shewanella sp. 10N.7]MCC4831075.1 CPBP family intramembrane metalloprotease [Shewanella sp. 10N.7]
MTNKIRATFLLAAFICSHLLIRNLWGETWTETLLALDNHSYVLHSLARWLFIYGPFVFFTLYIFRDEPVLAVLGLNSDRKDCYLTSALLCCVPMTLGYAYLSTDLNLSIAAVITGSIYPALFEEIIFRAILFGLLFRVCKWGFIPAAITTSLIFGFGHLYQSHDVISALMLFAFMAVAGSWFAWLYCECAYSIWYPMWMHLFMNATYGIFGMSGDAMGEASANIFKGLTIVLSLVYVYWFIKKGKPRAVTKQRLWKS